MNDEVLLNRLVPDYRPIKAIAIVFLCAIAVGCNNGTVVDEAAGYSSPVRSATLSDALRLAHGRRQLFQQNPDKSDSWRDSVALKDDLLYVSDEGTNDVYMFRWPDLTSVGKITGLSYPQGLCADSDGDVFVANLGTSEIIEFPHGQTKPVARLTDAGFYPIGCDVDSKTGDLAVANIRSTSNGAGNIALYRKHSGGPLFLEDPYVGFYYCAFDSDGNLFADDTGNAGYQFAELPVDGSHLVNISLDEGLSLPGGIQAVGDVVAVGDSRNNVVLRFKITDGSGLSIGTTKLVGASYVQDFSIVKKTLIGPNGGGAGVMFWAYPHGGKSIKEITKVTDPVGTALSRAPHHQSIRSR